MQDSFLFSILPYAVLSGIAASIVASASFALSAIFKMRADRSGLLPRISKLESAIRTETFHIDRQLDQIARGYKPEIIRSVISDLSFIAHDLQERASEVRQVLNDLRADKAVSADLRNRKQFVDIGLAVGKTEANLEAVVKRISQKKNELEAADKANSESRG